MENSPWNQANADSMTVDSWGGGTAVSAFPPLVPVNSNGSAGGGAGLYQCPTHPQHKTSDPSSFCPLCESAWERQRQDLQAKRQSVEEQLQNLKSVDSAAAILQDLQVSMKEWKPQPEENGGGGATGTGGSPPSMNGGGGGHSGNNNNNRASGGYSGGPPSNDFFGRTHPNNNNNNGVNGGRAYQTFQPNSMQQQEPPPPPPPPMPQNNNGSMPPPSFFSPYYDQGGAPQQQGQPPQMQAFAMQLHSMQRMQDWLLWQKEQECQALRSNLEEMRTEVQQLRVDKALLQEKLYQQEERMKHELKLIKMAALQQQQQQNRKKVGNGSNASGSRNSGSSGNQNQPPVVLLPEHMLSNPSNSQKNQEVASLSRQNPPSANSSQATPKTATVSSPTSAFATNTNNNTPPAPPAAGSSPFNMSLASYQSNESPVKKTSEIVRVQSQDESVRSGKSQQSRDSAGKRRTKSPASWIVAHGSNATKKTPTEKAPSLVSEANCREQGPVDTDDWVQPEVDDHDNELEDMRQQPDMRHINQGDDDDDDTFDNLVRNANSTELPMDTTDLFPATPPPKPSPSRNVPIKILNVAPTSTVPLQEDISSWTLGQQPSAKWKAPAQSPRGVSFPDSHGEDDTASLGQTVASSTFGEDRQKVVDQVILDPYGDRGTYTGIILRSTGMPHGPGRMIYQEDRRTYDGEWRHGRWHGYGRATFANGDTYDGEYRFDQRHGRGRYQWSDGRVYDGMFREDRRHGRGTFTWPDGAVYEGEFRSGQREGQGSYQFSDGGRYEGSWKDGRYNGYGVCKWEDGRCYKGEWLNGMAHGKGIETFADGTVRHDGQWIEDEPVPS